MTFEEVIEILDEHPKRWRLDDGTYVDRHLSESTKKTMLTRVQRLHLMARVHLGKGIYELSVSDLLELVRKLEYAEGTFLNLVNDLEHFYYAAARVGKIEPADPNPARALLEAEPGLCSIYRRYVQAGTE